MNKQYQEVTVKETFENDRGRRQKVTRRYLVDAVSATEAEAKVNKLYNGTTIEFKVTKTAVSSIFEVVN